MNHYHQLFTAENSAVVFIDHQPQMTFGVANIERSLLINNVVLLAKVAKEFNVPTVLTAVETESFSGYLWPQLLDPCVQRRLNWRLHHERDTRTTTSAAAIPGCATAAVRQWTAVLRATSVGNVCAFVGADWPDRSLW